MIKVSDVVYDIVQGDEVILEALREGVLNYSACARRIKAEVEGRTLKEVQTGSIVTALSRLSEKVAKTPKLRPSVNIENLSVKSPLTEITYEKTDNFLKSLSRLRTQKSTSDDFFTITQGLNEVTLIIPKKIKPRILKHFNTKPKGQYDDLVAVTIHFIEKEYLEVPNMIYSLVATLASKRINLIEIVSTYTEISFIVRQKDLRETVNVLEGHFCK